QKLAALLELLRPRGGSVDAKADPDLPAASFIGSHVPMRNHRGGLIDPFKAPLSLADRLDREAPETGGLRPRQAHAQVEPVVDHAQAAGSGQVDAGIERP